MTTLEILAGIAAGLFVLFVGVALFFDGLHRKTISILGLLMILGGLCLSIGGPALTLSLKKSAERRHKQEEALQSAYHVALRDMPWPAWPSSDPKNWPTPSKEGHAKLAAKIVGDVIIVERRSKWSRFNYHLGMADTPAEQITRPNTIISITYGLDASPEFFDSVSINSWLIEVLEVAARQTNYSLYTVTGRAAVTERIGTATTYRAGRKMFERPVTREVSPIKPTLKVFEEILLQGSSTRFGTRNR